MGNCACHKANSTNLSSTFNMPQMALAASAGATYRSFEYLSPVPPSDSIQVDVHETTTTTVSRTEKTRISFGKGTGKKKGGLRERLRKGLRASAGPGGQAADSVPEIMVTSPGGARRKVTSVRTVSDGNQNVSHFAPSTEIDVPDVSLGSYLLRKFDLHSDQVACIDPQSDENYRYRDMANLTRRVASALWKRGFRQGNTLCIVSGNSIEIAPVLCAVLCSGGTCALLEPDIAVVELSRCIRQVRPMVLMTEASLADECLRATSTAGILTEIYTIGKLDGFHALAELQTDNGSCFPTGIKLQPKKTCALKLISVDEFSSSKLVELSHYNVLSNILQLQAVLSVKRGSTVGCFLSVIDHFGLIGTLLCSFGAGAKVILVKTPTMEHCITAIIKYKPKRIHVSPDLAVTMFEDEMMSLCDLSNLESLLCGASPSSSLSAENQISIAEKIGNATISQAYGSNNTLITHCGSPLSLLSPGSCGSLVPNTSCKIIDEATGLPLHLDAVGEIWVKGPQCMNGNMANISGNSRQLNEWMFTGDVGRVDDAGNLFVTSSTSKFV